MYLDILEAGCDLKMYTPEQKQKMGQGKFFLKYTFVHNAVNENACTKNGIL